MKNFVAFLSISSTYQQSQQKLPAVQTGCWYLRVQWVKVLDDYVEIAKVSYHLALKGFVSIYHIRSFQQNKRPTRWIIVIDFGSQFMGKKCKNKCIHSGMTLAFSPPLASSSKQPGRNKHWYLHVHNKKKKQNKTGKLFSTITCHHHLKSWQKAKVIHSKQWFQSIVSPPALKCSFYPTGPCWSWRYFNQHGDLSNTLRLYTDIRT